MALHCNVADAVERVYSSPTWKSFIKNPHQQKTVRKHKEQYIRNLHKVIQSTKFQFGLRGLLSAKGKMTIQDY